MAWEKALMLLWITSVDVFAEICSSNHSLGLGSGSFTERGLIATTFLDAEHTPNWARLHYSRAWAPAVLHDQYIEQYFQLTFFSGQFIVKNIAMQGSPLSDWWVTKFRISTSNDGEHFMKDAEEYDGNYDRSSVVMVALQNSTPSIYFRLIPTGWKNHIAMRLEIYGCFRDNV